jgi:hypothetical protein
MKIKEEIKDKGNYNEEKKNEISSKKRKSLQRKNKRNHNERKTNKIFSV